MAKVIESVPNRLIACKMPTHRTKAPQKQEATHRTILFPPGQQQGRSWKRKILKLLRYCLFRPARGEGRSGRATRNGKEIKLAFASVSCCKYPSRLWNVSQRGPPPPPPWRPQPGRFPLTGPDLHLRIGEDILKGNFRFSCWLNGADWPNNCICTLDSVKVRRFKWASPSRT